MARCGHDGCTRSIYPDPEYQCDMGHAGYYCGQHRNYAHDEQWLCQPCHAEAECPDCQGEGDLGDSECERCDGFGHVVEPDDTKG